MRVLIKKAVRAVKAYQFALPLFIARKMLCQISFTKRIIIFSHDLNRAGVTSLPGKSPAAIQKITSVASEHMCRLKSTFPDKDFTSRLGKNGWQCYVAIINDQIVAYGWVVEGEFYISEIDYHYYLHEGQIFIYDCYVCPDYRGMHIYPDLIQRMVSDNSAVLTAEFKTGVAYIGVDSTNTASLRGVRKAGFTEINSIRYLHFKAYQRWWCRRPVPVLPG